MEQYRCGVTLGSGQLGALSLVGCCRCAAWVFNVSKQILCRTARYRCKQTPGFKTSSIS